MPGRGESYRKPWIRSIHTCRAGIIVSIGGQVTDDSGTEVEAIG